MVKKTVESVMTRNIVTLAATASIREAVNLMADKSISCIVVADATNKPIGIVTERDIIKKVLRNRMNPDEATINSIMSSPVVTITKDTDILEAMMTMQKNRFRRVVVTDSGGMLIGLVTQTDLFKAIVTLGV